MDHGELAVTALRSTRGIGILSWKGCESLRPMLQRLTESGFLDMFEERMVFFPEIDDEARELATEFDFSYDGSPENLGIYGGFRALAEPLEEAQRQMAITFDLLENDAAKVVCLRHRQFPGDFEGALQKYQRYFPPEAWTRWHA